MGFFAQKKDGLGREFAPEGAVVSGQRPFTVVLNRNRLRPNRSQLMQIRFGFDIAYELPNPAAVVLMLRLRPEYDHRIVRAERFRTKPSLPLEEFTDAYGNRAVRMVAHAGLLELFCEGVVRDAGIPAPVDVDAKEHPVEELPTRLLPFLLPQPLLRGGSVGKSGVDALWRHTARLVARPGDLQLGARPYCFRLPEGATHLDRLRGLSPRVPACAGISPTWRSPSAGA